MRRPWLPRPYRLTWTDRLVFAAAAGWLAYMSLHWIGFPDRAAAVAGIGIAAFALGVLAMVRFLPGVRLRSPLSWRYRR